MAPNDDSSKPPRPVNTDNDNDNPFVAFRRFADAHVSFLFDSLFSIPSTIADARKHSSEQSHQSYYSQHAEAGAIPRQKVRLEELNEEIPRLHREIRDHVRKGEVSEFDKKSKRIRELRQEKYALKKEIFWLYSDCEAEGSRDDEERYRTRWCRWRQSESLPKLDQVQREIGGASNQTDNELGTFDAKGDEKKQMLSQEESEAQGKSKVWSWSWSWPPTPNSATSPQQHLQSPRLDDSSSSELGQHYNPSSIVDALGEAFIQELVSIMAPSSYILAAKRHPYSPWVLERDEHLKRSGIHWRDAYEDLTRQQYAPGYPTQAAWSDDEPSYEYSHDHEDQHDDPPTPRIGRGDFKSSPEESQTEPDAYERLLGPIHPVQTPQSTSENIRPSVLSTLTTTERIVSPDGTITTKVVLKKRFSDGKEESSETVHTARSQSTDDRTHDLWTTMQEAHRPSQKIERSTEDQKVWEKKRSGWFWSN